MTGISLPPLTTPNLFTAANIDELCRSHFFDIRDACRACRSHSGARPEIVFHLAAQPLVRASYREPLATFETNVMGTAHVLEALRGTRQRPRCGDGDDRQSLSRPEVGAGSHREDDPLGRTRPLQRQQGRGEIVIESYRESYLAAQGVAVASARAGNVIGGGDWSEDRLIPDAVRAWQAGKTLDVRRPDAVRPWQHVLEPLSGYLTLAQQLWERPALAGAYNFGPDTGEADKRSRSGSSWRAAAYGPGQSATMARASEGPHESAWLALDTGKAKTCSAFHRG